MEKIKDIDVDIEVCKENMTKLKQKVQLLNTDFNNKYNLISEKIPLLKNTYESI